MSTLRVNNISDFSGGTSNLNIPGTAKAWVNFNGTGTVAIRASLNVSSITDNGTGDYTVNFTTAMPDANYSAVVCNGDLANGYTPLTGSSNTAPTSSSVKVGNIRPGVGAIDNSFMQVAIFR